MTDLQILKLRIERLENIIGQLTGRRDGAISDEEFLKACERKDKLTIHKYWDQQLGRNGSANCKPSGGGQ